MLSEVKYNQSYNDPDFVFYPNVFKITFHILKRQFDTPVV